MSGVRMSEKKKGLITGKAETGPSGSGDIFRQVFEKIQTGILVIDPATHTIVDANPIAEFLTGRTRDHLLGSTCHEFVCPAKCGECPITDYRKDIHNIERALINANGERIPILKTVARVAIGGKEYLIESFIDITDRKRSEERKIALIAYLSESILRARIPLGLIQQNFLQLADQVKGGEYDSEDIRMQLQIHANNLNKIVKNLEELQQKAIEGRHDEIPTEFKDFFMGK
jgi:PAS domain S-box-containing protein